MSNKEIENTKEKKAYMPLEQLIGQAPNTIFGVDLSSMDKSEKERLERGLMTDKVYNLTTLDGKSVDGKIQLTKNTKSGEVQAVYKPQYEKPFIPQKTFDGHIFTSEQIELLKNGLNVIYNVKLNNGNELTKLAKLDIPKYKDDVHYTNQLTITDISRLPIEKLVYNNQLTDEQKINFLNGKGAVIVDPLIKGEIHKGELTIYFDPIKGGSKYNMNQTLKESIAVSKLNNNNKEEQTEQLKEVTKKTKKNTPKI